MRVCMPVLTDDFLPVSQIDWDRVKASLLAEFDWTCEYCRAPLAWSQATYDHVIPRCQGGTDHVANLTICCRRCNSKKGGRTLQQWRDPESLVMP